MDQQHEETINAGRNAVTKRIRQALKQRSGKAWSVTGGKGTAYGWINIEASPHRNMTDEECAELAQILGLERPCHFQGESIPAGHDYYREYIDRAEGRAPSVQGKQYWD